MTGLIRVIFLACLVSVIDLLFLYSLLSVMEVILQLPSANTSFLTKLVLEHFSQVGRQHLLLIVILVVAALSIFRLLVHLIFRISELTYRKASIDQLSLHIFKRYVDLPISQISKETSSLWIRSITDIEFLVNIRIGGIVVFTYESIVLIGIVIYLLSKSYLVVLLVGLIYGALFIGMSRMMRYQLKSIGEIVLQASSARIQVLSETLRGLREVRIYRTAPSLLKRFSEIQRDASLDQRAISLGNLTPIGYETISILCLGGLALITYVLDLSEASTVSLIGTLSIATLRLAPSLSRISATIQRFASTDAISVYTQKLSSHFADLDASIIEVPLTENSNSWSTISLEGVSYKFSDCDNDVLSDLSLSVSRGERVAVLGASGAGKSTLVDILTGLVQPTRGKAIIDGVEHPSVGGHLGGQIGFVPQVPIVLNATIEENIIFGFGHKNSDDLWLKSVIQICQLQHLATRFSDGLPVGLGEGGSSLSGGERQRIGIARAIYRKPTLLVLDEATSALDEALESTLMKGVIESIDGITMIMITHRRSILPLCTKVYDLQNGKLVIPKSLS